ncbi:MAG: acetylxylan esterase [Pirellulaceae bacterium]|jgi:dienelactone hydrolase|nr:acetylxylan esterase [Pirellulaceae bacterium]MDP7016287.1 acetylxylan esterase [Pirellulaceae bacterium]
MNLLTITVVVALTAPAAHPLDVLDLPDERAQTLVYDHLAARAQAKLRARRERYETLKTPDDIRAYQREMKEFFVRQLGGFPERTPLDASVTGKLDGGDYRVEKVIYHSRPHHRVTAALYLPKTKPPYPAVLIACGHSKTGKAAGYNQRLGIILATHGIAAMCYDPIGQGERSQILDADGKPKFGSSTSEHLLAGVGSILVGANTATYRAYDGIRGIDYLVSRPDIVGDKIGCTGCSGGGTLTSYIMSLDERVACAVPSCYLTTFSKLIETIGPQDAEQNIFGQIEFGMDHPDYVIMRAPRPTLICATTGDYFSIEGAWDNFRQSKRVYARLGYAERVDLFEFGGKHGVPQPSREAMARWMSRWLLGVDKPLVEPEIKEWTVEQLRCTKNGEVLHDPTEFSVFDLNDRRAAALGQVREEAQASLTGAEIKKRIARLSRVPSFDEIAQPKVVKREPAKIGDAPVERLSIQNADGFPVPCLFFRPAAETVKDVVLYLPAQGKRRAASAEDGSIRQWVKDGKAVLAIDVRGVGETASSRPNHVVGADWKNFFTAYLLGDSFVGMRAADTYTAARYVQVRFPKARLHLVAEGELGPPALHAAALADNLFATVELRRSLRSWSEVPRDRAPANQLINCVHGALTFYDLPDLVAMLGDKAKLVEPTNSRGEVVEAAVSR